MHNFALPNTFLGTPLVLDIEERRAIVRWKATTEAVITVPGIGRADRLKRPIRFKRCARFTSGSFQTLHFDCPTRAGGVRGRGRFRSALVPMIGCGYPDLGYAISASEVPCGSHTSPVLIFGWLRSSRSLGAAWGHKSRARCDQAAICGCSDQSQH